MSALKKYFPEKRSKRLFQVQGIDVDLVDRVNVARRKNKQKWNELVSALFRLYLDQESKK